MEVPVKIKLQQIGRMVGRLTRPAARTQVPKTERLKIERVHIRIDRPHRIIPPHIIFNLRRQKTGLFTANAGFEVAIRHTANPTSIGKIGYEFLPSLACETHPTSPTAPHCSSRPPPRPSSAGFPSPHGRGIPPARRPTTRRLRFQDAPSRPAC